ncbi:MAG: hypothetical protein ACE5HA_06265, partial [Anaerolineae bacterium]
MSAHCSSRRRWARCVPSITSSGPRACPEHGRRGGCTTTLPTSIGARVCYQIDRDTCAGAGSEAYKQVYKQRTAGERVNSQAVELGIERPRIRNGQAIANQNSLIYVLINPS